MAELRAGGMAIIICSRFPENVGKVVKLVAFAGEIHHPRGYGIYWEVEAMSSLQGSISRVARGRIAMAKSKSLMPIGGDDFSNEDERQKEREHA